jgi:hypothetical protein
MTVNEETLPGTERRQWDRGAIHVAERYRLRRQERSRDGSVLGRNPVAVERIKRLDRMEEAGLIERRPRPERPQRNARAPHPPRREPHRPGGGDAREQRGAPAQCPTAAERRTLDRVLKSLLIELERTKPRS